MSILQGNRVALRPIEKKDLIRLNEWKNNESVYRNLGGGFMPVSINIQEKWMDDLMDTTGNSRRFMIIVDDTPIGMVGIYDIKWVHRTCEMGIFIGEESEQGKGYGQEAYRLIEDYAARYLNMRKINVWVVEDNIPAMKMYAFLGFLKAGTLTEERFIDGTYHPVAIMEKFVRGGVERRINLSIKIHTITKQHVFSNRMQSLIDTEVI